MFENLRSLGLPEVYRFWSQIRVAEIADMPPLPSLLSLIQDKVSFVSGTLSSHFYPMAALLCFLCLFVCAVWFMRDSLHKMTVMSERISRLTAENQRMRCKLMAEIDLIKEARATTERELDDLASRQKAQSMWLNLYVERLSNRIETQCKNSHCDSRQKIFKNALRDALLQ